ncbi:lipoyl domain-containing protein [Haladaptatus sp. DFWS20]|uniref:lipoyl domain-containing protein n=1 Tax=Haladaptatus sp. DFWS20 TaxID=3403467 RepID=UPI003EBA3808
MNSNSDRVAVSTTDVWPADAEEDEAVVVNWFVTEGSHVDAGDDICEFQIEKVSIDVTAPVTGTLDEIVLAENDEFGAGATLAWIRPD